MSQNLRRSVLEAFKSLHKARKDIFHGDDRALSAARLKINEEYKNCKKISDTQVIGDLIKYSKDVEAELRSTVIQAKEVAPGKYKVKLRDDTVKLDNVPFKDCL